MKSTALSTRPIELPIVAQGAVSLSIAQLADVRQHSIARFSASLRPQLLKHSDEQTLAAAVALDRAIAQMEAADHQHDFSRWAVLSATRYLGRTAFSTVIDKYKIDGPWGVSVQVIPHTSPHALASSLSLALASHGPCLGSGAAPGKELEAIFTAATLLTRPEIAGAWVVFSGWSSESPGGADAGSPTRCQAAVLALLPGRRSEEVRPVGRIGIHPAAHRAAPLQPSGAAAADLLDWLVNHRQGSAPLVQTVSGGLEVRLELSGVPRSSMPKPPHFETHHAAPSKRRRPSAVAIP